MLYAFAMLRLLPLTAFAAEIAAAAPGTVDGSCKTCQALALDQRQEASVSLLQRRGAAHFDNARDDDQGRPPWDPTLQKLRLERAKPLAWLHIPKCGSSVENLFIHLPGMCPGIPDDVVVGRDRYGPRFLLGAQFEFNLTDPNGACNGALATWGSHSAAGPNWDKVYEGHAVGMFRQPEQRIISGWNYGAHSWSHRYWGHAPSNISEYADIISGCSVRMLTRGGHGTENTCGGIGLDVRTDFLPDDRPTKEEVAQTLASIKPTKEEVASAIHRIHHGFVFVGITGQWALSMCLAHRMFGGPCLRSDFVDNRLSIAEEPYNPKLTDYEEVAMHKVEPYDTAELEGFTDPFDGPLYEAVLERFASDLERFNVSMASCQQCFKEAGVKITE